MTVFEEVKEAVHKLRATGDFEAFKKFMDELDIGRDGNLERDLACSYLLENISIEESANLI
ncbi:TPA: hypothetical protein ACTAD5_004589 [Salmonella enterica subsp. enterica serovar Virchow]